MTNFLVQRVTLKVYLHPFTVVKEFTVMYEGESNENLKLKKKSRTYHEFFTRNPGISEALDDMQ
jgi:hypothetical protein